jgi:NAD(P)-dependent dehydrogenase (short-subunit alcohol dehydrogenase family)
MPSKSLNKSILILGGTSGMGLSAAIACKEAGACPVVVGRDAESAELARPRLDDLTRFVVGKRVEIHHWTSAVCRRRLVGQRKPDSVIR